MESGESGERGQIALFRVQKQSKEEENARDQSTEERNVKEKHRK